MIEVEMNGIERKEILFLRVPYVQPNFDFV